MLDKLALFSFYVLLIKPLHKHMQHCKHKFEINLNMSLVQEMWHSCVCQLQYKANDHPTLWLRV